MAPISHVLIYVAMEEEAAGMIKSLGLKPEEGVLPSSLPAALHRGTYAGLDVALVTPGRAVKGDAQSPCLIGTDPAALTTFTALQALQATMKPQLLLNAGTAGGFRAKGGAIGDAYIVTSVQHHDRRIPIPGYDTWVLGKRDMVAGSKLAAAMGAKMGPCSTGNSLDCPEIDAKAMEQSGAVVKEMECAAIAWAAELCSTPMLALKVVTDIVDGEHPTQDEFLKNLATAAESLQKAVPAALDFIAGKSAEEL
eukprot:TRINITY_DN81108_c0_g1_i1.p1 TRINITY_DN81108_c0_g1~~TRINITY_DN81108_c0_g1_i1.p1  ORF type:complete len:252 (+),score=56.83 TRINITY_DN81108_c0_g1_i1:119-874(+)